MANNVVEARVLEVVGVDWEVPPSNVPQDSVRLELADSELWDMYGDDHYVRTDPGKLQVGEIVSVTLPEIPGNSVTLIV